MSSTRRSDDSRPSGSDDRRDSGTDSRRLRDDGGICTISYSIDRGHDDHESWLLGWTVDWMACSGVENVEVARTQLADSEAYEIVIDLAVGHERFRRGPCYELLFSRLERQVDRASVNYWKNGEIDPGYC